MAEELWLPSEFLADENLLMKYRVNVNKGKRHDDFPYWFENSYRPNSNLSSPVESIETENDKDDYITGLTRKIAYSTVRDSIFPFENSKGMGLSCSPQSTLCNVMGWCECKQRSSRCISRVSSPPRLNLKDGAAWDLLYAAAAEEVAMMRMIQEANGSYSSNNRVSGVPVPPRKPGHVAPLKNPNYGSGISATQSHLSYRQIQATTQQLKLHRMMKQQQGSDFLGQEKTGYQQMVQNGKKNGERPQGLSMAAWPTLQQSRQKREQPGSGMKAVFLGDPGTKKERSGTGVFLPRRFETATETRNKQGCSTFLIPDRVAQALNLNLESMNTQPQPQSPDYDAALMYRNNLRISQQKHRENLRAQAAVNQEPRLPQEWTY